MDMPTDELDLVKGLKNGTNEAFERFFDEWKGPLFGYLFGVLRSADGAEDVLQEVFIKILRGVAAYDHRGRFKQWVFQVAYNAGMDYLRKVGRRRDAVPVVTDDLTGNVDPAVKDPLEGMMLGETLVEVEKAIELLPEEQRTVLHLRIKEDLSFREISEIMETSINTTLGRMHYALKTLRARLSSLEGERLQ